MVSDTLALLVYFVDYMDEKQGRGSKGDHVL